MARDRQTIGPPASEPEQRDYAITIIAPDGTTTSAGIARSHHALDAAREAAEARSFAGPFREWVGADGRWSIADRDGHTVVAIVDTPHAQASVFAAARRAIADASANNERAAAQRTLAGMIRAVPDDARDATAAGIFRGSIGSQDVAFAALAAAAKYPEILDAINQCAQVHRLEGG